MSDGEICARHFATGEPVRLRWKNGVITHLDPAPATTNDSFLAPGLVDLQINGYSGIDFQRDDLSVDDLLIAGRKLRADGCPQFLLTLITDEWPKLTARLRHIKSLRAQSPELQAAIAGWHVEGPFLSTEPGFHGAHNPALMLDPTPEHIRELRALTGDEPLLLTLAPERNGSIETIALAISLGIKISLGHTNASSEILRRAAQAGATAFTHLGNGCPRELDRHDNIILRVLETPGLTVSVIPDKIHVSPPLFRLLHRAVAQDAIYYTTDAMSAAGAPPGRYHLGAVEVEVGADQIVRQPGKTNFAGSALRPIDGVLRASEMLDGDWREAWRHASEIPARLMGLPFGLEVGKPANFTVIKLDQANRLNVQPIPWS